MSPLKTSLLAAVLSGVVTAGALFHFHRERAGDIRRLQSQNNRLRLEAYQRSMVRPVAAPSPAASTSPVASIPMASTAGLATSPAPRMAEYYRNEGNATPLATLQTFAWACDRGDVEAVSRLLYLDPDARSKAEAFMAALPEATRGQWKTVDEMAASVLTHSIMVRPFPIAEVLATATPEVIGEERVRLRLPNVPKDRTEYQKTGDGWKYALTGAMVDAYISSNR